jgi:catechol 2,3-dioxygenase-like lactoylglutathione lyase family enzyme
MPAITDRSTCREPMLKVNRIGHGTLASRDIARTRRWYEEVLGFEVIQTSPVSLMIRKGTEHVYVVVQVPSFHQDMDRRYHNGLDVDSREDVDSAYQTILKIKDQYGVARIEKPGIRHGDYSFYFSDCDGNWWEIVHTRAGGYSLDFGDPERDLTGHHEFAEARGVRAHMHDPAFRAKVNAGG